MLQTAFQLLGSCNIFQRHVDKLLDVKYASLLNFTGNVSLKENLMRVCYFYVSSTSRQVLFPAASLTCYMQADTYTM